MASLKIDNVSEAVMKGLEERARHSHRTIEDEARAALTELVLANSAPRLPVEELLARAKAVRDMAPNAWLTEEMLEAAINEGRP